MSLNIVQICQVKYPGEVEKLNIMFRQDEFEIMILKWDVQGVPKPTEAELLAQSDQYTQAYNLMTFMQIGEQLLQDQIDSIAKSQQYTNGVYCVSYAQSTNPVWAAEAQAFIAWRDSMYAYALQVFTDIQGGQAAPTQEEFVAGFPEMIWPAVD